MNKTLDLVQNTASIVLRCLYLITLSKGATKIALVLLLSFGGITHATNMKKLGTQKVYKPNNLQHINLYHKNKKFYISENGVKKPIQNAFIDKAVRSLDSDTLTKFLKYNYLTVKHLGGDDYKVNAHVRGRAGGPAAACLGYWLTKVVCYGTAVVGTGALVVSTAGVGAGVVTGAAATAAGTAVGAAAGGATVAGVTAATGAGVLAGGVAGGAIAGGLATTGSAAGALATAGAVSTTAAGLTVSSVSAAGGVAAAMGAVESLALSVGAFCAWLPTP